MPTAMNTVKRIELPSLDVLLQGMPERSRCRCGNGLPQVGFDFYRRTWCVWCGCGLASDDMGSLDYAILDFNTKNNR